MFLKNNTFMDMPVVVKQMYSILRVVLISFVSTCLEQVNIYSFVSESIHMLEAYCSIS